MPYSFWNLTSPRNIKRKKENTVLGPMIIMKIVSCRDLKVEMFLWIHSNDVCKLRLIFFMTLTFFWAMCFVFLWSFFYGIFSYSIPILHHLLSKIAFIYGSAKCFLNNLFQRQSREHLSDHERSSGNRRDGDGDGDGVNGRRSNSAGGGGIGGMKYADNQQLFVGNLPLEITEKQLKEFFDSKFF